nr:keratin-associated protein 10-8-like [Camelus dromedarius]
MCWTIGPEGCQPGCAGRPGCVPICCPPLCCGVATPNEATLCCPLGSMTTSCHPGCDPQSLCSPACSPACCTSLSCQPEACEAASCPTCVCLPSFLCAILPCC